MKKKILTIVLAMLTVLSCVMLISCKESERPTKYIVTFDSMGGSAVASQEVEANKYVIVPEEPQKEGDIFLYWYATDKNIPFRFDYDKVESNITLRARWENSHTIVYKIGNEVVEYQEVEKNTYATKPTNPTKDNSAFAYWCLEGTNEPFDFSTTEITNNITLKAKFLAGSITDGQIKFYLGSQAGNSMVSGITAGQQNISASAGDTITLPRLSITPVSWAKFLGWVNATTDEKYLVEDYPDDYSFVYDGTPLLLYAIWE